MDDLGRGERRRREEKEADHPSSLGDKRRQGKEGGHVVAAPTRKDDNCLQEADNKEEDSSKIEHSAMEVVCKERTATKKRKGGATVARRTMGKQENATRRVATTLDIAVEGREDGRSSSLGWTNNNNNQIGRQNQ
jgi:hypothetical protein